MVGKRDDVNSCAGFCLLGVVAVGIQWGGTMATVSEQEANLQLRNEWVGKKLNYLKLKLNAQDCCESGFKVKTTNTSRNSKNHTVIIGDSNTPTQVCP